MQNSFGAARFGNVVLGAWLFVSAFVWPHAMLERLNAVIVGALCVAFALLTNLNPKIRYGNAVLAGWLFCSAWAFPVLRDGTLYNHLMVAVAMFCLAVMPAYVERRMALLNR